MNIKKILLVDDDDDDRIFFSDAVKEICPSFIYEEAYNGLEALLHLQTKPPIPDIIFLDLNMPKMNGYELLTKLKEDEQYNTIPVVIYTTSQAYEEKERALKMGASHFFSKPCDYVKLKITLQKILEQIIL